MKKSKLLIIFSIFGLAILLFAFKGLLAQTNSSNNYTDSNDAIAVRIIPNPEHLSISNWYESRGFSGAPQTLIVDGYEAIRDGRTVYVNAANVKGKEIFTNVYLISYNQDPSVKTIDILGQIVKNWKFNTDLKESVVPSPSCQISSVTCEADSDCKSDQYCLVNNSSADWTTLNTCQLKVVKNCSTDVDCPQSFFCNSVKAKIIRDIKRISKTEEIKQALYAYKSENGYYPKLESGSYLAGQAVSVWPSWNDSFLSDLSLKQVADPINRLGICKGYDSKTCWNKDTKRFFGSANGGLILPAGSFGFIYRTVNKGLGFDLCATMETKAPTTDLNFKFSPESVSSSNCVVATGVMSSGLVTNTAPRLVNSYLVGEAEQEYSGSIVVVDDQNNPLDWYLNSGFDWDKAGWSSAPVIKPSSVANSKKIYATKAGKPGVYPINLVVSDGRGGVLETNVNITIINPKSFIEAENLEYTLDPSVPLTYSFYFTNQNLSDYSTAATVTKVSGPTTFDLLSLFKATSTVGTGHYQVTYQGQIPTTSKFTGNEDYVYKVSVKDKFGETTDKNFKITIKSENPVLNFNCANANRVGKSYSCLLGPTTQANQNLSYYYDGTFAGLSTSTEGTNTYLKSANTTGNSSSTVNIKATNQYGASSTKAFDFKVDTYCGDGIQQNPNTEGKGGIYNDGQEDCDGTKGVALTAETSSEMAQYACATSNSETPNPIITNSYCVFKSPVDGGGFCGDGYCQTQKENKDNCSQDCLSTCVPQCNGNDCGNNGCGGTCGECAIGDECFGGKCCTNEGTFGVLGGSLSTVGSVVFNSTAYSVYFNGKSINNNEVYSFTRDIVHGKNVLAIQSTDASSSSISAQIKQISQALLKGTTNTPKNTCRDISTANVKNWKCTNVFGADWFALNFDDNSWSAPNTGFKSPNATIWALDYTPKDANGKCTGTNCGQVTTAYCRYTFIGDATSTDNCVPDSSTKECGGNGCEGNFRPDNCPGANNKNTNFYCSNGKCACDKLTCNNGINYGLEGSLCGVIDDKCNKTIDCAYNCADGYYCNMKTKTEFDKYGKGSDYDNFVSSNFVTNGCNAGKAYNTCQKKCWFKSFAISMEMRQGDVPNTDICSLSQANDNPKCSDNTDPSCPKSCSIKTVVSSVSLSNGNQDRCWNKEFLWGCWGGCKYDWQERTKWTCKSGDTTPTTYHYKDICNSVLSYEVDKVGDCGPCLPNCVGKNCGTDNGCGGKCDGGGCASGEVCLSGACKACTSNCAGKGCGESDGCKGLCSVYDSCGYDYQGGTYSVCKNATCAVCVPSCTGKCGADNGCKGTCMTGSCTGGQICQSGTCITQCTPICTASGGNLPCGTANSCGGTCNSSSNTCTENNATCTAAGCMKNIDYDSYCGTIISSNDKASADYVKCGNYQSCRNVTTAANCSQMFK